MDFSLNDDQVSLVQAARRFLESQYPYERRGQAVDEVTAQARWSALAQIGLLGLPFQARWGGTEQGLPELALLGREMGRCHAGEGYLASVVLCGRILQEVGSPAQCERWLPRVVSGQARLSLAHAESTSRYELSHVQMRAAAAPQGHALSGHKTLVLGGAQADVFLVLARTRGEFDDRHGLSLFLVPRNAPGLSIQDFRTLDGRRAAHVQLNDVRVDHDALVGAAGEASAAIEAAIDAAIVWTCAEAVGAMDTLIGATTDHLKNRRQFGSPLSKFQVLQHRLADGVIALEQAEAMVFAAAMIGERGPPELRRRVMATTKALTGQAGQQVGETAIQLHGAMGMTDECRVGHFAKLLTTLGLLFGDTHHHVRWYAQHALPAVPAQADA
jgi:alkylation response protein AidB-like acyl-CoA dehydrogenase